MENSERLPAHRRPEDLESELGYFRGLLEPLERKAVSSCVSHDPQQPLLFIMGCARSGSTLVLQYLASSGAFAYPTNFLSRFYYAPHIGARMQRMLYGYDFAGEMCPVENVSEDRFGSRLGKTQGPLAPHEFWYFWRKYFEFSETQELSEAEIAVADGAGFAMELRALQSLYKQPFVMKGMMLNWNIPYLAELVPNSRFLFIERDPRANASSLLRARQEFFGDSKQWYSFKPPGHQCVAAESPEVQVAWQVLETNAAVASGLQQVDDKHVLRVQYEEFCSDPQKLLRAVNDCWHPLKYNPESLPAQFSMSGLDGAELRVWDTHFDRAAALATRLGNQGGAV
jgi:hypothetical protein